MAKFTVHGRLSGAVLQVGDHAVTDQNQTAVIAGDRINATWINAPADGDPEVEDLQAWFESYLLAMGVTVAEPSYVHWDGLTRYRPDGSTQIAKFLSMRWGYVRQHPMALSAYSPLAATIRTDPIVKAASLRLRSAFELMQNSHEAGAAEAYKVVEQLCGSHKLPKWEAFGNRLNSAGLGKTALDLRILWASSQFYRHDQGQIGPAQAMLTAMGIQALDYGRCCWEAAELLEAYVAGKANGTL